MDLEAEVRRLTDERDVAAVLARYAQALDSNERGRIPGLFDTTGDGQVTGMGYEGSTVEWLPMFMANMDRTSATSVSTHFLGNRLLEVDGDDATIESYCIAHQIMDPGGRSESSRRGLRYQEHLVRGDDGAWRIHDRHVAQDWRGKGNPPGSQPTTLTPNRTEP